MKSEQLPGENRSVMHRRAAARASTIADGAATVATTVAMRVPGSTTRVGRPAVLESLR